MITKGKLLKSAITTLFNSWGSDPPPEVFWAYTEVLDFINAECKKNFEALVSEEMSEENEERISKVTDYLDGADCNGQDTEAQKWEALAIAACTVNQAMVDKGATQSKGEVVCPHCHTDDDLFKDKFIPHKGYCGRCRKVFYDAEHRRVF